jgi:Tol biopolymer transport system component
VGTAEREIISDQDADRPRWSPDGKRFAFISTKESGSQVWIADFDDASGIVTATYRLTEIATEASGELWSPDGKNILFVSDVYPECEGNLRRISRHRRWRSTGKKTIASIYRRGWPFSRLCSGWEFRPKCFTSRTKAISC